MAFWNRITSLIAGGAVARAASDAATPVLEPVKQHAWQQNQLRVLDPGTAAELVAQAIIDLPAAIEEASRSGIGENRLRALYLLSQTVPGFETLLRALNRDTITREQFDHALAKHKIDPAYWDALVDLRHEKLDPVQLANAIHRGLVPDPGLLAVPPPTGQGNVPAYPIYPIDALVEALAAGIDRERLGVLVGLMGLPMGPHEAAQAVFRGILTDEDFQRAIAEGNTRNEWGEAIREQTRQIPTARDFIENALRGYRTLAEAQKGAALHGMSPEHARMIFQNSGRPLNLHQITQALAWGAKYNPLPGDDPDPYMNSVLIGAVTPAYYEMQDTLKYNLPSAFFFRVLQEQHVLTEDEAVTWYKRLGWPPELAAQVAKAFAVTTGGGEDPWIKKATDRVFAKLQTDYLNGKVPLDAANHVLDVIGVDTTVRPRLFELWDAGATV